MLNVFTLATNDTLTLYMCQCVKNPICLFMPFDFIFKFYAKEISQLTTDCCPASIQVEERNGE